MTTDEIVRTERVVTLRGICNLMKAWKVPVILLMAVCACIFGTRAYQQEKALQAAQAALPEGATQEVKVKVPADQFELVKSVYEYEKVVAEKKEYLDRSVLMNIDPMHKKTISMRYSFTMDIPKTGAESESTADARKDDENEQQETEQAGVQTQEDKEQLIADYRQQLALKYLFILKDQESTRAIADMAGLNVDTAYFNELFAVENTSEPGTVLITIVHDDAEMLRSLADATKALMEEKRAEEEQAVFYQGQKIDYEFTVIGDTTIMESADPALLDTQTTKRADLSNQENAVAGRLAQMTPDGLEYLELYRDAVNTEGYKEGKALKKQESVKIQEFSPKRAFLKNAGIGLVIGLGIAFLLVLLIYLFSPVLLTARQISDMFMVPLLSVAKNKSDIEKTQKMLKTLTVERQACVVSTQEGLAGLLGKEDMIISPDEDPVALEKMRTAKDGIILAEQTGRSNLKRIEQILTLACSLGLPIRGVVILQGKETKTGK